MLLHALDTPDPRRKIRAQKPAVRGLVCKPANGREAEVDGGGSILLLLKADPVSGHHVFVESEPRFRAVPVDEFADGMIVRSLGTWEVRLFRPPIFDCSRSGSFKTVFGLRLRLFLGHASSLHRRPPLYEIATIPSPID